MYKNRQITLSATNFNPWTGSVIAISHDTVSGLAGLDIKTLEVFDCKVAVKIIFCINLVAKIGATVPLHV